MAGRPRRAQTATDNKLITVRELCNLFLDHKDGRVVARKIKRRSWADYQVECARPVKILGATPPVDYLNEKYFDDLLRKLSIRQRGVDSFDTGPNFASEKSAGTPGQSFTEWRILPNHRG